MRKSFLGKEVLLGRDQGTEVFRGWNLACGSLVGAEVVGWDLECVSPSGAGPRMRTSFVRAEVLLRQVRGRSPSGAGPRTWKCFVGAEVLRLLS